MLGLKWLSLKPWSAPCEVKQHVQFCVLEVGGEEKIGYQRFRDAFSPPEDVLGKAVVLVTSELAAFSAAPVMPSVMQVHVLLLVENTLRAVGSS